MKRIYVVFGVVTCLLFVYAESNGWNVYDSVQSGKWGPQGQSSFHK